MSHFAAWTPIAPTAGEALFVAPSPGSTHELLTRSFPRAALLLLGCQLVWVCIRGGRRLFFGRHGRWHRLPGLAYVLWSALGCTQLCAGPKFVAPVIFDAVGMTPRIQLCTIPCAHRFLTLPLRTNADSCNNPAQLPRSLMQPNATPFLAGCACLPICLPTCLPICLPAYLPAPLTVFAPHSACW